MRSILVALCGLMVAACQGPVAEFWRPISEPNLQMSLERAQVKLDFDLGQCNCGIFPKNVMQPDLVAFQPDKQRLTETAVLFGDGPHPFSDGCVQRPSLVVSECMRSRGWEVTRCTGRVPVSGGGAMCSAASIGDP